MIKRQLVANFGPVTSSKVALPPLSEWSHHFPSKSRQVRDRVSVQNPSTAAAIAESFVPEGSCAKIILEAYPGPGALTRALLNLPRHRIQKLIVLEDHEPYLEFLRPLEKFDSRIRVLPLPAFSWDTYVTVKDLGLFDDVTALAWNSVHPQLHFISHLPRTVLGEQLIAQLFRGIPEKSWLFKYGRVPMNFIMSDWVWQRISASISHPNRCKLSVIAEAVSNFDLALPPPTLQPYEVHFHPVNYKYTSWDRKQPARLGHQFQAVSILPREIQVIRRGMLDKWDYCLRHLFVRKSTSLKSSISYLAPGAEVLIKEITNSDIADSELIDIKKEVRKLTVAEWAAFIDVFDRWPFAPEDLSISDSFGRDERL